MANSSSFLIRFYPVKDRTPALSAELMEIWEESVRKTHLFLEEEDILALIPEVSEAIATIPNLAVMVDANDRALGFLGLAGQKVEILFLSPGAIGQGLGRRLIEWALDRGAVLVDVNRENLAARDFYLHLGFKVFAVSERLAGERSFSLYHLKFKPDKGQERGASA
jgi:putative acetyltransferase